EVVYDDLPVLVTDRVGEEGKGFRYLLDGLNAERILVAAEALGIGRAAINRAVNYANERVVFNRPIGQNQGIAFPLGEAHMRLEAAGFDPDAMSSLFTRLLANNRFGRRPPEFLLSHPVTESRIADARGRSSRYPAKQYSGNLEYQIMRARVVAHYATDKAALVSNYRQLLAESTSEFTRDANRYGLVVAYWEDEQYRQANETLAPLLLKEPNRISYVVTQAEIYTAQNEPGQAIVFLRRHLEINPDNHPLTMAFIEALTEARDYSDAARIMEKHTQVRPNDHLLWYELAETQGQAGNISKVHQARAEYFRLVADYRKAREQLQFALRIETDNGAAPAVESRIRQKIRDIEQLQAALSG
ncbi:MAG: hypothetical protein IIC60_05240, partial [Proteobacteria bacterium]|nr:hypothetical protein [Pseudomonadota bacterium]